MIFQTKPVHTFHSTVDYRVCYTLPSPLQIGSIPKVFSVHLTSGSSPGALLFPPGQTLLWWKMRSVRPGRLQWYERTAPSTAPLPRTPFDMHCSAVPPLSYGPQV